MPTKTSDQSLNIPTHILCHRHDRNPVGSQSALLNVTLYNNNYGIHHEHYGGTSALYIFVIRSPMKGFACTWTNIVACLSTQRITLFNKLATWTDKVIEVTLTCGQEFVHLGFHVTQKIYTDHESILTEWQNHTMALKHTVMLQWLHIRVILSWINLPTELEMTSDAQQNARYVEHCKCA